MATDRTQPGQTLVTAVISGLPSSAESCLKLRTSSTLVGNGSGVGLQMHSSWARLASTLSTLRSTCLRTTTDTSPSLVLVHSAQGANVKCGVKCKNLNGPMGLGRHDKVNS